jgi:hypothetical protein
LFLLVNDVFLPFLKPPALAAASDHVLPALTMIHSRADRRIDLNDHGQFRGRVIRGRGDSQFARGRYCRQGLGGPT